MLSRKKLKQMIVEITGPSGAGKTSYITKLLKRFENSGVETGAIHNLVTNRHPEIPDIFSDLETQNIRTDIGAAFWSIAVLLKNPKFTLFIITQLWSISAPFKTKLAIFRSLVRKTGIYGFLSQKKFSDVIILVDEGIFHLAHNFLISPTQHADKDTIHTFLKTCPRPDGLIILIDNVSQLIQNQLNRKEFSPRVNNLNELEEFIKNAHYVYSQICKSKKALTNYKILDSLIKNPERTLLEGENFILALKNQQGNKIT